MPKPLKYLLAWAVATSIGVGVALLGVQVVLESTSAERPSLVKAPEAVAGSQVASGTSTPQSSPSTTDTPSRTRPPATATTSATPRPAPSRTPADKASPELTRSPSRLCEQSGGTGAGDRDEGTGFIQSYEMLGGKAAIRFAPGRVCLVSATPRSGHVVTVSPERPDRLFVRFTSRSHQSELEATWAGRPVVRSKETFG